MKLKNILKYFWKGVVPEPFEYPYTRRIPNIAYGKKATFEQKLRFVVGFIPILRNRFYKFTVIERIAEDPFVISEVSKLPNGAKVLDFGCFASMLPMQLSSAGYKVTGVDYYDYIYKHPNFKFFKGNFLDIDLPKGGFDLIYAVSVLEHVGIGWYDIEKKDVSLEKVIRKIKTLLKPRGEFIMTVPYGNAKLYPYFRVFGKAQLRELFKDFRLVKEAYFLRKNNTFWILSDDKPVGPSSTWEFNKVACWVLRKK